MTNSTLYFLFLTMLIFSCTPGTENHPENSEEAVFKTPLMGWASWNNYRVNINEEIGRAHV